ncbi:hypothetical protein QCA50_006880 [Cerrena zonata]|uniref:DNA-directed DNA polymerase X domain-containing protein n=1 Tax=Cerrena zonata TaxID=2478898 RepID=A0AAW0GF33_9APHY
MLATRRIFPTRRAQLCCIRGYAQKLPPNSNPNPNQGILDMLAKHREIEKNKVDSCRYKLTAFSRAMNLIAELEEPITSIRDTVQLPRLGHGVQGRILAYLNNEEWDPELHGKLAGHDIVDEALRLFQGVRGIGAPLARKLVKAGCRSIEQLTQPEFSSLLPQLIQTDIQFQAHWDKKATRTEAERVSNLISDSLPGYEVHLVGPYRRLFDESEKIDLVVVHPNLPESPHPIWKTGLSLITSGPLTEVQEFKEILEDRGLIAGSIGTGTRARGLWHWEGWVRIPELREGGTFENVLARRDGCDAKTGEFRLMRFALVGKHALGSALLIHTGDDEYVKLLDKQARKMGMYLNGEGLWSWVYPDPAPEDEPVRPWPTKGTEGKFAPLPSHTEEVVLEQLGQQWVPPEKRNFKFLKSVKGTLDPTKRRRGPRKPKPVSVTPPPQYTEEQLKKMIED